LPGSIPARYMVWTRIALLWISTSTGTALLLIPRSFQGPKRKDKKLIVVKNIWISTENWTRKSKWVCWCECLLTVYWCESFLARANQKFWIRGVYEGGSWHTDLCFVTSLVVLMRSFLLNMDKNDIMNSLKLVILNQDPPSCYSRAPGSRNHGFWRSQRVSKHALIKSATQPASVVSINH